MREVSEITTEAEFAEAFAVMQELRTHLTRETYGELLEPMRREGYRLFALRDEGQIVALAGTVIMTNFYDLRHVYVYDLITTDAGRSKGYGAELLTAVEEHAQREDCAGVTLSSGVQRLDAHRFYVRQGYDKTGFVFRKRF